MKPTKSVRLWRVAMRFFMPQLTSIMTWSSIGFVYAAWVVLPLFIQARVTHQWYVDQFGDSYPKDRKAIIPFWV